MNPVAVLPTVARAPLGAVLLGALVAPALPAQREYLEYPTFEVWRSLAPELTQAVLCQLTEAGHALWAADQLRLPVAGAGVVRGDFRGTGREDWAVLLRGAGDRSPCEYVLIATQKDGRWQRLSLHRLAPEPETAGVELVWNEARRAIGIDVGKRSRVTLPATLTVVDGQVLTATTGSVIEQRLIWQRLRWNPEVNRFDLEQEAVPEAWDIEQSSRSP